MILCTSDINGKRKWTQCAFYYLLIAIFVAAFGAIYEVFSHGVYSWCMLYAFAFPLFGGTLPFLSIGLFSEKQYPTQVCVTLYHCGIATMTVGSIIQGILEIYGTTNMLVSYYWIVGIILIATALVINRRNHYLLSILLIMLILVFTSISACHMIKT